jgi:quinol-cytochrome oxidoreductase complex cytochrome b subunit
MTATAHAVIGTIIAAKIGNPVLAVPIALASHFAADMFPHWDTGTHYREKSDKKFLLQTFADVMLGFAMSYVLILALFLQTNLIYAFFIIVVSQLPDWITAPYLFFKIKTWPFMWMYKFQREFNNRLDKPWGIITQVAVLLLLLIIAKSS